MAIEDDVRKFQESVSKKDYEGALSILGDHLYNPESFVRQLSFGPVIDLYAAFRRHHDREAHTLATVVGMHLGDLDRFSKSNYHAMSGLTFGEVYDSYISLRKSKDDRRAHMLSKKAGLKKGPLDRNFNYK